MRSLVALDRAQTRLKGPALADAVGSSAGFVSQAMTPLVRAGWVRSEPGPTGGYSLDTALCDLSVLDVVEAVEGPTDTDRCVLAGQRCDPVEPCALHGAWTRARERLIGDLGGVSLAEATAPNSPRPPTTRETT